MPSERTRIPRTITEFVLYMHRTDDYQLAIDPVTSAARYLNWGWTLAESTAWTDFRNTADGYYDTYGTKAMRTTESKENLELLIDAVVAYDTLHKLLDKITIATMPPVVVGDFLKFNVKRGTPLADTTPTTGDVEMGEPSVNIKAVDHLVHFLEVELDEKGHVVVNRIKEVEVWRAIVPPGAAEPKADAYVYIGDVKRGTFKSVFTEDHKRMDAWYKSRCKSNTGKFGDFGNAVSETVI